MCLVAADVGRQGELDRVGDERPQRFRFACFEALDHEHEDPAGKRVLEQAWQGLALGVLVPPDGEQAGEMVDRALVAGEMTAAPG
jgi:hypothetical protein